jgi:dTDP-4-dehydrorhamnose reductase
MTILLLGKNGQVGWELQRSLAPLGDVIALDRHGAAHPGQTGVWLAGDLADPVGLARTVEALRPQVIVNAAAHTAVDRAESEPDLAHLLNAEAPGALARAAQAVGAWLVHYSTDYVFDGSGHRPWREDDATGPINTYGRSKLQGEDAVRAACERHLILRTSWVYAARGGNFARTMLRLAAERETLKVISDQVGAPTGAELLADVTAHAVRRLQADASVGGTYHCAAAGFTSWHGYAQHVIGHAWALGRPLKAHTDAVQAISTREYPTPAQRPLNSRLDCSKLQHMFGLQMPPWQQGVDRMLTEVLGA